VPTTAGTGSEAQTYALISDARTHVKMACGDPTAAFRVALLDPALTCSQPPQVTARSGYDALSHAVESYVTTKHNAMSDLFAREAWRLLTASFQRVLEAPADRAARGGMLLGAHLAGMAIEQSMLGASHACANPLTARFGIDHGEAIALMLPHVVAWNSLTSANVEEIRARYAALAGDVPSSRGDLSDFLSVLGRMAALGGTLRARGIPRDALPQLADDAATQWTGRFNPRPFDAAGARELYEAAW
jgi:alcohol dehydrogenase